ncbi:uncharacterized protein LOC129291839 [Prosopis cineraria]|uniref:uncharacterized protein LOC129291839 n=1 Tax=Prosopis cineraria TaxID=364024 RepID=UPI0024104ABF|nr:uncharacterized protein LOC129291839 [Prosopis cineraria]
MASFGTTQRIPNSSEPPSSSSTEEPYEPKASHEKQFREFNFYCPLNIPLTPEAAALRIIRNLGNLGLYYTLFVWIILFITLIPQRKVSLILLVIMSYVTTLYLLLLKAYPNSYLLHRVLDKRFVLALLAIATMVQLIVTSAGIHLGVTLACSVPIVLLHAVLWISHQEIISENCFEASGVAELALLSDRIKNGGEGPDMA